MTALPHQALVLEMATRSNETRRTEHNMAFVERLLGIERPSLCHTVDCVLVQKNDHQEFDYTSSNRATVTSVVVYYRTSPLACTE
jgi:hypothetical protein